MKKSFFVTGIDTDIGKTIVSAILVEALQADYWKPIQSGDLNQSDSMKVKELTTFDCEIYLETFRLNHPLSPHISSKMDGISISLDDFKIPETDNNLIIEGAGGLLVPINNESDYLSDLIMKFNIPVILVIKNYLGSINHTLLSINYLQSKNISIYGLIVVGDENTASEQIIVKNTGVKILCHIPITENLSKEFVREQANLIQQVIAT